MSILAVEVPATQPSPAAQYAFIAFLLLVGLAIARAAGVFRRGSIRGPSRLEPDAPRGGLVFVTIVAIFLWIGAQMAIGSGARLRYEASGTTRPFGIDAFTAADFALLSTVPFFIGALALLIGDALLGRQTLARLGLTLRQLLPGIAKGFVGILILIPVVIFASVVMEAVYEWVGFEHPSEHELLRAMTDAENPLHRALLIIGATLLAPLFEEILFRGHLQTLIVAWTDDIVRRLREPAPVELAFEVITSEPTAIPAGGPPGSLRQDEAPSTPNDAPPSPTRPAGPPSPRPVWRLWFAVIVTSILFAIIHPDWSIPAIFVLSLGLGYAYERTGNLWVPIMIHLMFNTFQTTMFLLIQS